MYLDIEGLAGSTFYYLIGALVVADGQENLTRRFGHGRRNSARIGSQTSMRKGSEGRPSRDHRNGTPMQVHQNED